ncbi:MAG: YceI family protein, partial [Bacteroidetes bacterium]|nr:YceI family protein [Bacteroidota bacterium]
MANVRWKVDPMHSEVQFKVKHLMITTVTGYFSSFDIEAETESEDFTSAKNVVFTADVDSISTNNEQRDTHLKSADFFDAANHGQIRFVGNRYEKISDDEYKLHGELTI